MYREIDLETWERRTTFEFFREYKDPFFNMAANLDVTRLYSFCKERKMPFSIACLYFSLATANDIPEFRFRMIDEKVLEFDRVEATQTILNDDNTFSFCYFPMMDSLEEFVGIGIENREKYRALKTFDVEADRLDLIYYSVIPWVSFTSFKHASSGDNRQTVPRMVFGKMFGDGERRLMPFSVEAHHALMDGYHVGRYFNVFQEMLDSVDRGL
ncbi:MAG TPA: chloramphenicol acetyltransferase [Pyrinomonadaceae bacterium]|nr:chloramphenicol acetyltransferase [Pyrinomonadaceae bacterium]